MASLGPTGTTLLLLSLYLMLWPKTLFLLPKLVKRIVDCKLGLDMLEIKKMAVIKSIDIFQKFNHKLFFDLFLSDTLYISKLIKVYLI